MANKIKAYVSSVFKNCNVFACIIASLVIGVLVYACDAFNLVHNLLSLEPVYTIILLAVLGVGVLVLAVQAIIGLFKKSINIADSLIVIGVFGIVWGVVYTILTIDSFITVYKWIVLGVLLAIMLLFALVRINKCDGSAKTPEDVPEANATFTTYVKKFFKKFGIIAIIYSIVLAGVIIWIEQANIISPLLFGEKAVITWGLVALVAILFLTLYVSRVKDREINAVDVALFILAVGGLVLSIVEFTKTGENRVIVGVIGDVVLVVSLVLFAIAIKNTHIYTDEEEQQYKAGKGGFKNYLKAFAKHSNVLSLVATAFLISGLFIALSVTNAIESITSALSIDATLVTIGIVAVAVIIFAIIATDLVMHRVETVDSILAVIALSSIITLIANYAVLKTEFVPSGIVFAVLAVASIVLIGFRTKFVKELVAQPVATEEAPAVEETAVVEEVAVTEAVAVEETPAVEEAPAVEEVAEPSVEAEELNVQTAPQKLKRVTVKKTYEMYLRTGDEQLKENYSVIKNELLSYGMHARMTKSRENFSKKGISVSTVNGKPRRLQAKLLVRGKFLKLYLNVNPAEIDAKYFRTKDVSAKMPDQATYIKIRSKLSLKRAIELIALLAEKEGFKKKKKFENVDFTKDLSNEGLSYMQVLGYDYMVKDSVSYAEVLGYKPDWAERIVKSKIIPDAERYIYDEVTLDDISLAFKDGEVVDLEALRVKGLVKPNANYVTVKPSAHLTKKLFVEANVIDEKAVQMIAIAGGEATRLIFN